MNILLTCAGRRNYLVQYFKQALAGNGFVCAADASMDAPAMQEADKAFIVPKVKSPEYVTVVLDLCKTNGISLLVSLNDLELPILAPARHRFQDIGTIPVVSSPEVIDIAFDKWRTARFLETCGLQTCLTYLTLNDVREALTSGDLTFPLIVKPRWGTASISVEKVENEKELELTFELTHHRLSKTFLAEISASDQARSVMVQECLSGQEYGLDVVNDLEGGTAAVFVKQKLAMRAGETDRAITVHNEALERVGWKIGHALKHIGNLDCDVFLTEQGPRVLELNPRFGGGYPFTHEAGANIPAALIAWAKGEAPKPEWLRIAHGRTFSKCDRLVEKQHHYEAGESVHD